MNRLCVSGELGNVCPVQARKLAPSDTPLYGPLLGPAPGASLPGCGSSTGNVSTTAHTAG